MADAAPTVEKKKRKAPAGPRQARAIHVLLSVGEDGKPGVKLATYNTGKVLDAINTDKDAHYVSVVPSK